jgi:hypothetical protein
MTSKLRFHPRVDPVEADYFDKLEVNGSTWSGWVVYHKDGKQEHCGDEEFVRKYIARGPRGRSMQAYRAAVERVRLVNEPVAPAPVAAPQVEAAVVAPPVAPPPVRAVPQPGSPFVVTPGNPQATGFKVGE